MKATVTYRDANSKTQRITLFNPNWMWLRGFRVLRGQQRINKQMVNRTFAFDEVINLETQAK